MSNLLRRQLGFIGLFLLLLAGSLSAQDLQLGGRTPEQIAQEVRVRFSRTPRGADQAPTLDLGELCLTPLIARLRAAASKLPAAECDELAALDPNVALAINLGRDQAGTRLPSYPELDLTEEGTSCILYYTLTGEHAIVSVDAVVYMRKLLDRLAKKFAKALRPPFAETDGDPDTRLRVYIAKLATDPVLGEIKGLVQACEPVTGTTGKPYTVYMALSSDNLVKAGEDSKVWKKRVKATCTHEYMHCIQDAYNFELSRWTMEGQAVWAENRIANETDDQIAFLEGADSIIRAPERPLWEQTLRMYSTSPLFHYLDLVAKKAPSRLLEASLNEDDGLTIIKGIVAEEDIPWDEFYKGFLARMWYKKIPRMPKKIFPEITMFEAPIGTYGWEGSDQIAVTGYQVRMFDPPTTYNSSLFFAKVSRTGTMAGTPSGVILHGSGKRLAFGTGQWDSLDKFTKKYFVLIVTDTEYTAQTAVLTPYKAEVFAPYIEVTDITSVSPISPGGSSTITFTYNLLGVPFGLANFPICLHVVRKGPDPDLNSPTFPTWAVGNDQTATYTFNALAGLDAVGTYAFTFYAKVPTDTYGGAHTKSVSKTKVKVEAP